MVGHHCVEQLIERGALDRYRLHVFSEEPMRAYDRVHLSEYFSGRDAESLALSDAALYQTPGVTLHLGVPVLEIDRARRQVITAQGCVAYDKLVLATGSYPFVPPIEGAEGDSRLVYRTLEDLDAIRAAAANARRGVVVGGGLLGLEAANALKSLGLEAHVVEFAPRLMPVQLDDLGGLALKAQIERAGRRRAPVPRHAIDQRRRAVPLPDEFCQRRIPRNRPDRVLRRYPRPGRPGPAMRAGDRPARWRGDRRHLPEQRPAHLRHRRVRVLERQPVRPGRAGLPDGAQCRRAAVRRRRRAVPGRRHVDQAQAAGRRRRLHRRCPRQHAGRAQLSVHRRDQRQLPAPGGRRQRQARARRGAGRRQQLLRHPAAIHAERDRLAVRTGRADPAVVRRRADPRPWRLAGNGHGLLLPQRHQGRDLLGHRRRLHRPRPAQVADQGLHRLRRLRRLAQASLRARADRPWRQRRQEPVRALRLHPPGAVCAGAGGRGDHLRRTAGQTRPRPHRLRRLQAGGGLDPGVVLEPADHGPVAGAVAGHQRHLHGQHAEERHLFGGAAHSRRRDHRRQADRHRRGGEEIRPLHQDHRRPAHRPVRRPVASAAGHLGRADRRRLRNRPRLRQVDPHGEVLRRQHLVPLRRAGQRANGPDSSRTATRACARRTSSSSRCPAAPANAPRRRARTSA